MSDEILTVLDVAALRKVADKTFSDPALRWDETHAFVPNSAPCAASRTDAFGGRRRHP